MRLPTLTWASCVGVVVMSWAAQPSGALLSPTAPRSALPRVGRGPPARAGPGDGEDVTYLQQRVAELEDDLARAKARVSELELQLRQVTARNGELEQLRSSGELVSSASPLAVRPRFQFAAAAVMAGYAFETYNEPSNARWEFGSDSVGVAFKSSSFARDLYTGILQVTLSEADGLPTGELAEKLASGLRSNGVSPYVAFAVTEGAEATDDIPDAGVKGLDRATDVAESAPVAGVDDEAGLFTKASWTDVNSNTFFLYVREPAAARLVLTVLARQMLKDDEILGAASVSLSELLSEDALARVGKEAARNRKAIEPVTWSGWVPLTHRPTKSSSGKVRRASETV